MQLVYIYCIYCIYLQKPSNFGRQKNSINEMGVKSVICDILAYVINVN